MPTLAPKIANAALLEPRYIEMSNSTEGATAVTYSINFTFGSSYTVKGIIVDFCGNDPIVGDASCTNPGGNTSFDVGGATPSFTTSGTIGTSGWTSAGLNTVTGSQKRTLELTDATGVAVTSASTATINLTNVTNDTVANSTFYARILTYTTTAAAGSYAPGSEGAYSDYGGVALSTANTITITSKVQEQITFCVYTGANCGAGCTTANTAGNGCAITLGDTHGVLSSSGPFVDITTKYDIASNAANGVIIRVQGATLTSGSNSITAIGSSAASSSAGSPQFGLCTWKSGGAATLTPASPYNNASCNTTSQTAGTGSTGGAGSAQFAFNTTNTTSTYGDVLANATAGASSTGTIAFIGNIAISQQAGIYTTTLTFVATGSY
jgi:hypothetical protein